MAFRPQHDAIPPAESAHECSLPDVMLEDTGDELAAVVAEAVAVGLAALGPAERSGKSVGTSEVPVGHDPQQYWVALARPTV